MKTLVALTLAGLCLLPGTTAMAATKHAIDLNKPVWIIGEPPPTWTIGKPPPTIIVPTGEMIAECMAKTGYVPFSIPPQNEAAYNRCLEARETSASLKPASPPPVMPLVLFRKDLQSYLACLQKHRDKPGACVNQP